MSAVISCEWCQFAMSQCPDVDSQTGRGNPRCMRCGATNGIYIEPWCSVEVIHVPKLEDRGGLPDKDDQQSAFSDDMAGAIESILRG